MYLHVSSENNGADPCLCFCLFMQNVGFLITWLIVVLPTDVQKNATPVRSTTLRYVAENKKNV